MKRLKVLFELYSWIAALLLAPLSAWLWYQHYGNWSQTLMAWLLPVLWAYIVPGVGTNLCKVWEIRSRFNLGRFRIQHGFVFGSATALLAWLAHPHQAQTAMQVFSCALVLASVIGLWNILYDIVAIKAGVLAVYNQPWADGENAETIVLDYGPWIFAGFGFCYGLSIAAHEYISLNHGVPSLTLNALALLISLSVCITIPVLGCIRASYRKHGHSGTRPVARR